MNFYIQFVCVKRDYVMHFDTREQDHAMNLWFGIPKMLSCAFTVCNGCRVCELMLTGSEHDSF